MKKALIIGLGSSGRAVVQYLIKHGSNVVAIDKYLPVNFDLCPVFIDEHEFEIFDFDLVVVSPGVLPNHKLYRKAIDLGVELIGEAELAFRAMKSRVIGVTGSNGKSTAVMAITHVLNKRGMRARALGNIGVPLISALGDLKDDEIVVAELSSFQLETCSSKVLDMALILNVAPNHLDRHGTMENYIKAKRRIFACIKEGGVCAEDLVDGDYVWFAVKHFGVTKEEYLRAMKSFRQLPHRLEFVRYIRGVRCYNDSKATTMDAVAYGVRAIGKNIILIAGGRHKGGSFSIWNDCFPGKVKAIFLMGEAKHLIAEELKVSIPIVFVDTLEEAIEKGLQYAEQGDNLVLSPGCSSYDMFRNFEERGEAYKQGLEGESKRYDPDFSSS